MEYAIELKGLCKKYPDFSLKNVDLALPKGYIMGFIGANGRGKSTTIKAILSLIKADSGSVQVFGKETDTLTEEDYCKIGYVPDTCSLPEQLTYADIDKVMGNIYPTWDSEYFTDFCKKHKFGEKTKIKEYSKGMKMKVQIGVALSHKSTLLIMDEPTAGLDPLARDELRGILQEFVLDENNSVFLSSHITSDLEKICDYIAIIKEGEIVECTEKDTLLDRYVLLHLEKGQYSEVSEDAVIGKIETRFGIDALAVADKLPAGKNYKQDRATLEDILIFYNKEGVK